MLWEYFQPQGCQNRKVEALFMVPVTGDKVDIISRIYQISDNLQKLHQLTFKFTRRLRQVKIVDLSIEFKLIQIFTQSPTKKKTTPHFLYLIMPFAFLFSALRSILKIHLHKFCLSSVLFFGLLLYQQSDLITDVSQNHQKM